MAMPTSSDGSCGIKSREFSFAAESRVPREGTEGRKTLQGWRWPPQPPPRCRPVGRRKARVQGGAAGLPLSPDGAEARQRVRGGGFRARVGTGPLSQAVRSWPCRCTPAPFQAPSWNPPSAQGLSLEALNEAFQKFLKLPVPSNPGVTLSSIPPPPTAAGKSGCRDGAAGPPEARDLSAAQERPAGPGALGDPAPSRPRRKLRLVVPALRQPGWEEGRGGGGGGGGGEEEGGGGAGRGRDRPGARGVGVGGQSMLPRFLCWAPAKELFKLAFGGGSWWPASSPSSSLNESRRHL